MGIYVDIKLRPMGGVSNSIGLPRILAHRHIGKIPPNRTTHNANASDMFRYLGERRKEQANIGQCSRRHHPSGVFRLG